MRPAYRAWAALNWHLAASGDLDERALLDVGRGANEYLTKAGESWKQYALRWEEHDNLAWFKALPDSKRRSMFVKHITDDLCSKGFLARRVRQRLHAFYNVIAWHMWNAAMGAHKPTANDSEDLASLMHLAEPAFILTRDDKLIRAVDASGTHQAPWVRRLNGFLNAKLPEGRPWGTKARNALATFVRT